MVPMRSVPHRVVCLVGLDDGVFPRLGVVDGDDVLARDPMTGERDIRSEDRQLLLDAIGAATEKLVDHLHRRQRVLRSGRDRPRCRWPNCSTPSTGRPRRRSATRSSSDIRCSRSILATSCPASWSPDEPFTFDSTVLNAARARSGDRAEQPPFISGPLPAPPPDDVVLADLVGFFQDPVKGFFRALDYTLPWEVDGVEDAMPVDINALEEWTVGDRMLGDMLRDMNPTRRGTPSGGAAPCRPASSGWRKATEIRDQSALLADAARRLPQRRCARRRRRHRPRRGRRLDRHGVPGVR